MDGSTSDAQKAHRSEAEFIISLQSVKVVW